MLNTGRLRVLSEVVRRGSFSGAAEALSYTQSAVSQAIARLEPEVGATLLVRDRRGVRPTAAGATLVDHADAIFAQIESAEAELAAVLGVRGGRLRVASFPSAGSTLMPLAVAMFRRGHPDVALTLAEGEPEEIAPRLRVGEFDLALLFQFPGVRERPGAGLRTVNLLEDPMHIALPANHPLADEAGAEAVRSPGGGLGADLRAQSVRRHVVRLCLAAGFEPNVTFESDDYETVQGLVGAGVGVALIPRLALTHVHPGVVVRELARPQPGAQGRRGDDVGPRGRSRGADDAQILSDVAGEYAAAPDDSVGRSARVGEEAAALSAAS